MKKMKWKSKRIAKNYDGKPEPVVQKNLTLDLIFINTNYIPF